MCGGVQEDRPALRCAGTERGACFTRWLPHCTGHLQVNLEVDCEFVQDKLCGNDRNEIRVKLKQVLQDAPPPGE